MNGPLINDPAFRTYAKGAPGNRAKVTDLEIEGLIRGAGSYVDDISLADQAWLAVVRSPIAHAVLEGVDVAEAASTPGVLAVLTADDLRSVPTIPIRVLPLPGMENRRQPVLAVDRLRYVGEPVAIVVAESPEIARDAADQVFLEMTTLPPVLGIEGIGHGLGDDLSKGDTFCDLTGVHGDITQEFSRAAAVVECQFRVGRQSGVPIEPRGLIANWRGDKLHIWGITKYVTFSRATIADFFGMSPQQVVCHRTDVGGMFGVRGEVYPEEYLVPWASRVVGRPVKWVEGRREHFVSINHARGQQQTVRMAVGADGEFLALAADGYVDLGAYSRPIGGRLIQIAVETMPGPYQWASYDLRMKGFATNRTPIGTMRGPVSFETTFVRERLIDMAAARMGLDPVEIRRRNLIPKTLMPFKLGMGPGVEAPIYDSGDYMNLLADLLLRINYKKLRSDVAERRTVRGQHVGMGLAVFLDHSGLGVEETVELHLEQDGSFVLGTTAAEVGQRLSAMVVAVVSSVLEVDEGSIAVHHGDSRAHSGGNGTFASRTTIFVGSAAHNAAVRMKQAAQMKAADMFRAAPQSVATTPGGFACGSDFVHWKELAPITVEGEHRMERPTYGFGVAVAVVAVEPETGSVGIERLIIAYDCGRAIDLRNTQAQLAGAAIMGLGGALYEELRFDESGQPIVTSLMDYLIPTSVVSPAVEVHVYEGSDVPGNPLGVRGAGEAGVIGVGGCIANAVADALETAASCHVTELPIRSETLRSIVESNLQRTE